MSKIGEAPPVLNFGDYALLVLALVGAGDLIVVAHIVAPVHSK
jgi:hypothetical protein